MSLMDAPSDFDLCTSMRKEAPAQDFIQGAEAILACEKHPEFCKFARIAVQYSLDIIVTQGD